MTVFRLVELTDEHITLEWDGNVMCATLNPLTKKSNPLATRDLTRTAYVVVKLAGQEDQNVGCMPKEARLKLPEAISVQGSDYQGHYNYLKDMFGDSKVQQSEPEDNDHAGMIHNAVTGKWSWF